MTDVATQYNVASYVMGIPPNRTKAELLVNIENISRLSSTWKEPLGFLNTRRVVLNTSYNFIVLAWAFGGRLTVEFYSYKSHYFLIILQQKQKSKTALKYTSDSNLYSKIQKNNRKPYK